MKYTTLGQTNIKTTAIYTHLNEEKYAKKMQEYNFDKDLYDTQVERKSKKNNIINLNDFFTAWLLVPQFFNFFEGKSYVIGLNTRLTREIHESLVSPSIYNKI